MITYRIEDILSKVPQVHIRQYFKTPGFGDNQLNLYQIFEGEYNEQQQVGLLECREESNVCRRQWLMPDCRQYKMLLSEFPSTSGINQSTLMYFEKDYQFACCCFNRPSLRIFMENCGQQTQIGSIVTSFCEKGFSVINSQGDLVYRVVAPTCQWPNFVKCCCHPCQMLSFDIYDAFDIKVGSMLKKGAGCVLQGPQNTDNLLINFPHASSAQDKCLLVAGGIFLEYNYFDSKKQIESSW